MKLVSSQFQPEGRLQSIDALRGVAALGVVLYHAVMQTANAVPDNLFRWPVKLIQYLSSFGYIGVCLFFVISGFCIHLQWAKARANRKPHQISFGSFWKRRIRRLYPPYLFALALFFLMAALSTGIDITHFFVYDVVMHLLMLHNLDPQTCYSINGVFWTLAVEEQLYLAYFLLLRRWQSVQPLECSGFYLAMQYGSLPESAYRSLKRPLRTGSLGRWARSRWKRCTV
jgi:peptidoglycan/LPS O-acetylase OafA/YrhL